MERQPNHGKIGKWHSGIHIAQATIVIPCVIVAFFGFSQRSAALTKTERERIVALTSDSVAPKELRDRVFADASIQRMPELLPKNVNNAQDSRDYESFHDTYSQWVIKKFTKRRRSELLKAQQKYSVDFESIAAIMLVETGLGSFTGKYHVLSVYASVALEADHRLNFMFAAKEFIRKGFAMDNQRDRYTYKFNWSVDQLHALLKIHASKELDIFGLKGSSAGAFGLAQFLPSSFVSWSQDGNGDGKKDLFDEIDAIYSIGNYLASHGWKLGLENPENRKAIYAYNRSQIYVDTVLKVAQTLRNNLASKVSH